MSVAFANGANDAPEGTNNAYVGAATGLSTGEGTAVAFGAHETARRISAANERALRDRSRELIPDTLLDCRRRGPALLHTAADDRHLVRVEQGRGLEHVERFLPGLVVTPLEDAEAHLRDALVDAVEDHVLRSVVGPALLRDVDAVDENDALQ